MKFLFGLVFLIVVLVVIGIVVIYSGRVDVAARSGQGSVMDWVMAKTADRSVQTHARQVPDPDLAHASVPLGAFHYREMCIVCHGGPGAPPSEIGRGLNPRPPDLNESAKELNPREIYWVVKNGIRMTGMPSFGATHDEEELRAIAAFVLRLPGMSEGEFTTLADAGGEVEAGGHGEHGAGEPSGKEMMHHDMMQHAPADSVAR